MRHRPLLSTLVLAWLFATQVAAAAGSKDAGGTPDSTPVAQLWQQFMATANVSDALAAYDPVIAVEAAGGKVDKDQCARQMPALAASARAVPVGAGIWYSAYRCAAALGRNDEADRYLKGFAALASYAFAHASSEMNGEPVRIIQTTDTNALVNASGYQLLYMQYDNYSLPRYFPRRVVLWDAEKKHEMHLRFDYLDTLARLKHKEIYNEFPYYRPMSAQQVVEQLVEDRIDAGMDVDVMLQAAVKSSGPERIKFLKANLATHGVQVADALIGECLRKAIAECDGSLVDALLPYAEKGYALPTIQLAYLYAIGMGVAQDRHAAMTLLDKAESRLGEGRAYAVFAALALDSKQSDDLIALVRPKLVAAVAQGGVSPAIVLAGVEANASAQKVSDSTFAALEKLAQAGQTDSYAIYAFLLTSRDRAKEAAQWVLRAAEHGDGDSQLAAAHMYRDGDRVEQDDAKSLHWFKEAGYSGNTEAMIAVGDYYEDVAHDGPRAQGWFASADHFGDRDGSMRLAGLYRGKLPGLFGGAKDALAIYEELDTRFDKPEARRALASMLIDGEGTAKDTTRAKQLLLKDAEKGDARSRYALGMSLLHGTLGPVDEVQGQHWLSLAVDQGDSHSMISWGGWLYMKKGGAADIAKAKALWQQAIDKGSDAAVNEFAWAVCTANNPAMFDPAKGLALMKKLDRQNMNWARVDTLAACQAANNDFAAAQATQTEAIEALKADEPGSASLAKMQARLALYKQGQTYRSDAED